MHCHFAGPSPASCRRDRDRGRQLSRPGKRTGSGRPQEAEMNPSAPESDATNYVSAVLTLYLGLPETPLRTSPQDKKYARQLHDRGVPLSLVESAFLLASLRRLLRPADVPPLSPIRSLAYFQPVLDELIANPPPENYLAYL